MPESEKSGTRGFFLQRRRASAPHSAVATLAGSVVPCGNGWDSARIGPTLPKGSGHRGSKESKTVKHWRDLSSADLDLARKLRACGRSYAQIAEALGYGIGATKVRLAMRKRENPGKTNHKVLRHLDPFLPPAVQSEAESVQSIDWESLSYSQRYFGDPRPGRAAIDQLSPGDRKRLGIE